jgi:hypothetical protein
VTYKVKALVRDPTREVTTCIVGCVDEEAARAKMRELYAVEKIYWAKPEKVKQKEG